ncbi:acetyl xylan esterase [Wenjunlia vitaminophila]|uniref:Acetyl xylan esterase n=1 Tax=Wenjunlia vitaminophila TaxID=76728 RepID=A0A0T6LVB1_WENVI|nr:acetylxylan esterase [Wenjunlia vitaminophila]KRV49944.1 acetyl xylan esterase [Wenjunlia vitaminophila]
MPHFDLPLDQLREYRPEVAQPDDFDEFWAGTLDEARRHDLAPAFEPVDLPLTGVRVHDVTFSGFGGHRIKGWLTLPANATGPLPAVVEFVGYGGGRNLPHTHLLWATAGFAHLVMDTRGQGSGWGTGDTEDPVGSAPASPGSMTRGILDPHDYYYRRVFTDAVRAVETARSHPLVDPSRVAAIGSSQGGGITLAVGGLVPDLVAIAPDVPFLCHFRRSATLTGREPYAEIARYLKAHRRHEEQVFRTLSYFDGVNFASRGRAPALFSTALEDMVCPPSTVFSAYNAYAGDDKQIEVFSFNGHEGGGPFLQDTLLHWLPQRLRGRAASTA